MMPDRACARAQTGRYGGSGVPEVSLHHVPNFTTASNVDRRVETFGNEYGIRESVHVGGRASTSRFWSSGDKQ
jgi:hypothetical protein